MDALQGYGSSEGEEEDGAPQAKRARPDHARAPGAGADRPAPRARLPSALDALGGGDPPPAPPPAAAVAAGGGADAHQGRVRSFPHVEGHHAVTVFARAPPPPAAAAALAALLAELARRLPGLQPIGGLALGGGDAGPKPPPTAAAAGELHMSLSRTAPAVQAQAPSLVAALRRGLAGAAPRRGLALRVGGGPLRVFVNDENTRTFIALPVADAAGGGGGAGAAAAAPLLRAFHAASRAFVRHGLPPYYADPQPHVSVAWLLGDRRGEAEAAAAASAAAAARAAWTAPAAPVVARIGEREHAVLPAPGRRAGGGGDSGDDGCPAARRARR